jgi:cobalt-zinc-cadmium efflux system outer membrane protein
MKTTTAARRALLPLGLVLLCGCSLPGGRDDLEREVLELHQPAPPAAPGTVDAFPTVNAPSPVATALLNAPVPDEPVQKVALRQPTVRDDEKEPPRIPQLFAVPKELPGAGAKMLELKGPTGEPLPPAERARKVAAFFPPTQPLPPEPAAAPGPEGRPLTLADLQRLAATYSPAIKNAQAAVEAARGAAIQVGMYPNPTFSFENDTIQTGPAGYPGFSVEQVIKTGGKLKLQQASALMDVLNAKAALRRAQTDLGYSVRGFYFQVLVARENMRVSDALFRFTDNIYRAQVLQLEKGGLAAPYEPLQLRALVLAARFAVIQARNQYLASWRQLAASMGLPNMPLSEVAGRVDMPVPVFDFEQVKAWMFAYHTDVLTAENNIRKARYQLAYNKVVPLPDVDARVLVQKDYTTPPNQISASVQVSVPVPIWDQNKGGIRQAEAQLAQALVGPDQARNNLQVTLADAYNRYETAREQVDIAMQQVSDQLRAYVAIYRRRNLELPPGVGFGDVVQAQQTLGTYIAGYIAALGAQWQAVVDVANVLQTDNLFSAPRSQKMLLIPDLNDLDPDCKHAPAGPPEQPEVQHAPAGPPAPEQAAAARLPELLTQPAPAAAPTGAPAPAAAPVGVSPSTWQSPGAAGPPPGGVRPVSWQSGDTPAPGPAGSWQGGSVPPVVSSGVGR